MFEEHTIIKRFKEDVRQHVEVIDDEINKGRKGEAVLWLNEIMVMRQTWINALNAPDFAITSHPWVSPTTLNTGSTKHLAKERIEILDEAITLVQKKFQEKGWSM